MLNQNIELAKSKMEQTLVFVASELNKIRLAKVYFKEVIKNTKKKDKINIRSRNFLKKIK